MRTENRIAAVGIMLLTLLLVMVSPGNTHAEERATLYVTFNYHVDVPYVRNQPGPTRQSKQIREIVNFFDNHGIRPHFGITGVVSQQLQEDFPDTVEQMRKMRLAIGYHPGIGHSAETAQKLYGEVRSYVNLPMEDAIRAVWDFETHNLYPSDNPKAKQPIPNETGGWVSIQHALGVTPMQTDAGGYGALYEALGAGSYTPSPYPPGNLLEMSLDIGESVPPGVAHLPSMHEMHFYGTRSSGLGSKYYGKPVGQDVPMMISFEDFVDIMSATQPRDKINHFAVMSHCWPWDNDELKSIYAKHVDYLQSHPNDFKIVAPDPQGVQYAPENAPLKFYEKKYGVKSWDEFLAMDAPIAAIKAEMERRGQTDPSRPPSRPTYNQLRDDAAIQEDPSWEKTKSAGGNLSLKEAVAAADYLLCYWPHYDHDGNVGSAPPYLETGSRKLCLADAFQGFAKLVVAWKKDGKLPESIALNSIYGPVDAPLVKIARARAKAEGGERLGYRSDQLPAEVVPTPEQLFAQGMPLCKSGGGAVCWPTFTKIGTDEMLRVVAEIDKAMADRVPATAKVNIVTDASKDQPAPVRMEFVLNAAELLYPLAQELKYLSTQGKPGPVLAVTNKYTPQQVSKALRVEGGKAGEEFYLRGYLTKKELNDGWTAI